MVKRRLEEVVAGAAAAMGVECRVILQESYPGVVNHDEETAFVQKCASELLGAEQVKVLSEPTLTTEDFGYFLEQVPGCFYHVGVESEVPLHSSHFRVKESAIKYAVMMQVACVWKNLQAEG